MVAAAAAPRWRCSAWSSTFGSGSPRCTEASPAPTRVAEAEAALREAGHLREEDGATWFASTRFGERQGPGRPPGRRGAHLPAPATSRTTWTRRGAVSGASWTCGAPTITGTSSGCRRRRSRSVSRRTGCRSSWLQQVNLLRDGEPVKMSKREGELVTLDELQDEVGKDVSRFFFLMRKASSHLDFDLELAEAGVDGQPGVLRAVRARALAEHLPAAAGEAGSRARRRAGPDPPRRGGGGRDDADSPPVPGDRAGIGEGPGSRTASWPTCARWPARTIASTRPASAIPDSGCSSTATDSLSRAPAVSRRRARGRAPRRARASRHRRRGLRCDAPEIFFSLPSRRSRSMSILVVGSVAVRRRHDPVRSRGEGPSAAPPPTSPPPRACSRR